MAGVYTYVIEALPVGMTLEDGPTERLLVVGLPANNDGSASHASLAGIEVGDSIIRVEQEDITGLTFDQSIMRLKRAKVPLRVTVARPTPEVRDQLLAEVATMPGSDDSLEEEDSEDDDDDGLEDGVDGEEGDEDDDGEEDDEEEDDADGEDTEEEPDEERKPEIGAVGAPAPEVVGAPKRLSGGLLFGMEEVFGVESTTPLDAAAAPAPPAEKAAKKVKKKKRGRPAGSKNVPPKRPAGAVSRDPATLRQEAQQRFVEVRNALEAASETSAGPFLKDFDFFESCFKEQEDLGKWVHAAVYRHYVEEAGLTYDERCLRREQTKHLERFWRDGVDRGALVTKGLLAVGVEFSLVYLGLITKEGRRAGAAARPLSRMRLGTGKSMRESSNPIIQEVAEQLELTPCLVDVRSEEFPKRVQQLLEKVQLLLDQANVQGQHLDTMSVELDKHSGVFEARVSHVAGLLGRRSQIIRDRVDYLLGARQRHQYTVYQTRAALGLPLDGPPLAKAASASDEAGPLNSAGASSAGDYRAMDAAASGSAGAAGAGAGAPGTPQAASDDGGAGALAELKLSHLSPAERLEAEALLAEAERSVREIAASLEALLPETGLVQLYTGRENAMRRTYLSGRHHLKNRFSMLAQRYAEMLQVGEIQKNEFKRLEDESASLLGDPRDAAAAEADELEDVGYKIQLALPPVAFEDCLKQLPEQTVEQVKNWAKRKFAIPKDGPGLPENGTSKEAEGADEDTDEDQEDAEGATSPSPPKKSKGEEKEFKRSKSREGAKVPDGKGSTKKRAPEGPGASAEHAKRQRLSM